jgi:hypothetical protein
MPDWQTLWLMGLDVCSLIEKVKCSQFHFLLFVLISEKRMGRCSHGAMQVCRARPQALTAVDDDRGSGCVKYVLGDDVQDVATCNVCGEAIRGAVCAGDNGADVHFGCARATALPSDNPSSEHAHDKRCRRAEHQARWAAGRTRRRKCYVQNAAQSASGHIVRDTTAASLCQGPAATPQAPKVTPVCAWPVRLLMGKHTSALPVAT